MLNHKTHTGNLESKGELKLAGHGISHVQLNRHTTYH